MAGVIEQVLSLSLTILIIMGLLYIADLIDRRMR